MWTLEITGKGRRAVVLHATNEDNVQFCRGEFVKYAGGQIGLITDFKVGETPSLNQAQVLQCTEKEDTHEILVTPDLKWRLLDELDAKFEIKDEITHATDGNMVIPTKLPSTDFEQYAKTISKQLREEEYYSKRPLKSTKEAKNKDSVNEVPSTPSKSRTRSRKTTTPKSVNKEEKSDFIVNKLQSLSDSDSDVESMVDDDPLPQRKKALKPAKPKAAKPKAADSTLPIEQIPPSNATTDEMKVDFKIEEVTNALESSNIKDSAPNSPQKRRTRAGSSPRKRASPKKNATSPTKKKKAALDLKQETLFAADIAQIPYPEEIEEFDEIEMETVNERKGKPRYAKFLPTAENAVHEMTPIDRLLADFHPASEPGMHPCREDQFDQLFYALETAIEAMTGTCIYVSGTPGTGKTSTIKEVISQLDLRVRENELKPFKFIEINGMKLVHPNAAYELLWNMLDKGPISQSNAMAALETAFTENESVETRGTVVVLLDEMDQLITKGQQLMYNFFNWPSLQHSRLIVLAVANTMDLPERVLSNKISSRVGLTRIQFPGYTHEQLKEIVHQRLEESSVKETHIREDAIDYATRKVAGVGGDARRVLEFIRAGILVAQKETAGGSDFENSGPVMVKIAHIREAIELSQNSHLEKFLQTLSLSTKMFLCALLSRTRKAMQNEISVHEVLRQAIQFAKSASNAEMYTDNLFRKSRISRSNRLAMFQHSIVELIEGGIIVSQAIKGEATPNVRLMVPENILSDLLRNDVMLKGMV